VLTRAGILASAVGLLWCVSCATAPRPTEASRRIQANAPAVVEGRVQDTEGHPVAGIAVRGIPRGKDLPWSPAVETQCDGTFRLALAAPGVYGFLLRWQQVSVITPSPQDPARLEIPVAPGEQRGRVDLVFLAPLWRQITESAPSEIPSCP
jgi:hypothetical protein